jgi:hypothetical protein
MSGSTPDDPERPADAVTLEEIAAPPDGCAAKIVDLFDHWRAIHPGGGLLPGRQHFDPLKVPRLLSNLWMADVFRDPWRFRVRLMGTALTDFAERDDTGNWMHDIFDGFENTDAFRCMTACAGNGKPAYRRGSVLSKPERTYVMAERLYLPLAGDGQTPDMLLNMTLYLR